MAWLRAKAPRKTKKTAPKAKVRAPGKRSAALDGKKTTASKNRKAQWCVYEDLQKKARKAWTKLRADVRRKAPPEVLVRDRDDLLLLLGECNYLAGECMRMESMRRR